MALIAVLQFSTREAANTGRRNESLDLVIRDKLDAPSTNVSVEIAGIRQVGLFCVRGVTKGLMPSGWVSLEL